MASNQIDQIKCDSVDDLFNILRLSNVQEWGDEYECPWIFRGHSVGKWKLEPKLWRSDFRTNLLQNYEELRGFVDSNFNKFLNSDHFNDISSTYSYSESEDIKFQRMLKSNVDRGAYGSIRSRDNSGPTVPLLDRSRTVDTVTLRVIEDKLLFEFCRWAEELALIPKGIRSFDHFTHIESGNFFRCFSFGQEVNLEDVALAQHSLLPTRFLDWTYDPMKALVFAISSDSVVEDIKIWALNTNVLDSYRSKSKVGEPKLAVRRYDADKSKNSNLNAQSGLFTYFEDNNYYILNGIFPYLEHEDVLENYNGGLLKTVSLKVDSFRKRDILKRLNRERKTEAHLFPTLEQCAKQAVLSTVDMLKDIK
jgi:hypothetical protein